MVLLKISNLIFFAEPFPSSSLISICSAFNAHPEEVSTHDDKDAFVKVTESLAPSAASKLINILGFFQ